MDVNFATNTTLSLLNALGRSATDETYEVDSNLTVATADAYSSSGASVNDIHTLFIRDSMETGGYVYSALNLYSEQLDTLSGYLTQLRDAEIAIAAETVGSAAHTILLGNKEALETEMSTFIGSKVHSNDLNLIAIQGNVNTNSSFMDVISLYEDPSDTSSDMVGMVSMIEVDLMEIFAASHNETTCPHCLAAQQSNLDGLASPIDLGATSTTTSYTPEVRATTASSSSDSQVNTILGGNKWNISADGTLTYSFYEGTVPYPTTYNTGSVSDGANGLEQGITATGPDNASALNQVMAEWDNAVEFDFQLITENSATGSVGDIRFAFTNDGVQYGRAAFAYYPSSSAVGGDVWFEVADIDKNYDASGNDFNTTGLGDGGYSYYAALHEVGHALGLSHPFDGSSSSGSTLPDSEDNMRTSVMSYTQMDRNFVFQYTASGGGWSSNDSYKVFATTPMLADIKAMDEMYGTDTTAEGDTLYTFANDGTRNQPLMMQSIIDTGGTDTIDLSNQTKSNILDMRPGTLSSIGYWSEADQITYWAAQTGLTNTQVQNSFDFWNAQATANKSSQAIYTGEDNLGIAHNAEIENAIGGSGDDTITGNNLNNVIKGNDGNDTINGGDGTDSAEFSGDKSNYTIGPKAADGSYTVTDNVGTDGTDTLTNIEYLKFTASAASVRGASVRTSDVTASDLTGVSTFNIAVDGGGTVAVTFNGRDYTSPGLGLSDLASDLQTAINNALTAAGEAGSVSVTVNSPLSITSNLTGAGSAISFDSLSGPLQAALGTLSDEGQIQIGDTVYYDLGEGFLTTSPSVNYVSSNPLPPVNSNPSSGSSSSNNGSGGSGGSSGTPYTGSASGGVEANAPGLPAHIGDISVATQEDAALAVQVLDRAISQISESQAKLGALQNRLEYNISNLTKSSMLTETAKGRIIDADYAAESAILVKNQILAQAATQALNMANQSKQGVIGLLR